MESSEFKKIAKKIISNKKYSLMKNDKHHGLTRYEHSLRVAKWTFILGKKLNVIDYKSATKGAFLHDFFIDSDLTNNFYKFVQHPKTSLINAQKYFEITNKEKNIILSHMFPLSPEIPNSLESWLVTFVDKGVSIYEMLRFKLTPTLMILLMFMFDFWTIGQ